MNTNDDLRRARCERACWWLEQQVDVVPLKPSSKVLQPGYGASRAHITTAEFARRWFLNTDANLGVVLGGKMGLAVADWDCTQDYASWLSNAGEKVNTLTEKTGRGYHLFFTGIFFRSVLRQGCEFLSRGVCMVSPSVHPSGIVYQIVNNVSIARLTEEEAQFIFPFLSGVSVDYDKRENGEPMLAQRKQESEMDDSLLQRIKNARPIVDELEAAGVRDWQRAGKNLVAQCVFHQDASPSLWVNPVSGLWGCNAASCPVHDGHRAHDVINARSLWKGVSEREAIRQLAHEFLSPYWSKER